MVEDKLQQRPAVPDEPDADANMPADAPAPSAKVIKNPAGSPAPRPQKAAARGRPVPAPKGKAPGGSKGTEAKPEALGNLGAVVLRNEFYRDGYRSLLRLAVIQAIIIVGLVVSVFAIVNSRQPENRYFATTEDGRLIPMVPLSEPNLSTPALLSWAAQSVTDVMSFGFTDYKRRLQESSRNFTKGGWESFTDALQRSRIIEMMETNQQVLIAVPKGAPILQSEGVVRGRYQWVLQVPIMLSYQAGNKQRNDSLLVTLIVVRVPRLESPNGIGIEQWIAVPG